MIEDTVYNIEAVLLLAIACVEDFSQFGALLTDLLIESMIEWLID